MAMVLLKEKKKKEKRQTYGGTVTEQSPMGMRVSCGGHMHLCRLQGHLKP